MTGYGRLPKMRERPALASQPRGLLPTDGLSLKVLPSRKTLWTMTRPWAPAEYRPVEPAGAGVKARAVAGQARWRPLREVALEQGGAQPQHGAGARFGDDVARAEADAGDQVQAGRLTARQRGETGFAGSAATGRARCATGDASRAVPHRR